MKKFYLPLLFCSQLIFINTAISQTLLSEDFESGNFAPAGWTLINAGKGNGWVRSDNASLTFPGYQAYSGQKCAVYEFSSFYAADAWMITPALSLTAGQSYGISFYYRVADTGYPEKLKITAGKEATVAAQDTVLWNNNDMPGLSNNVYRRAIVQFIPDVTGTFYFGFNCYSDKDENALLADSIVVRTAPTAPPPCTSNISPVNNTENVSVSGVVLNWNAVSGATGYDLYIDNNNPPLNWRGSYTTNSAPVSKLAYNTTYHWYVVPYNAAGYAKGCATGNGTAFKTRETPPTLPVTLKDFTVTATAKRNLLKWSTASEQNNSYFQLQRAGDGIKFLTLATIKTKATNGNSSLPLYYNYEDVAPLSGVSYYRLEQFDKDGKSSFSKIISTGGNAQTGSFSLNVVYPNPVSSLLNCKVVSAVDQKISFAITDLQGRIIAIKDKTISQGTTNITLKTATLANGIYYLTAVTKEGVSVTEKFMKQN